MLVSSRSAMRTFMVGWLIAFCVMALGAAAIGRLVASAPAPPPRPEQARRPTSMEDVGESGPFTQAEAVEVVARRFGSMAGGERLRQQLRASPTVTYYSPAHWRVCLDAACWIAHGPGRYAEPENDAARQREVIAANGQ